MTRHLERRGPIVEADARMLPHRIDAPRQHVRPSVVLEQGEQRRVVMQADEHQRIDAAAEELLGDAQFGLEVVVVLGHHQRVALAVEHRLHGARGARIERVAEGGHDRPDHPAAVTAESPRGAVRHVAQLDHGIVHEAPGFRVDALGRVEHTGDGGRRNAGKPRNVLCAASAGRCRADTGRLRSAPSPSGFSALCIRLHSLGDRRGKDSYTHEVVQRPSRCYALM